MEEIKKWFFENRTVLSTIVTVIFGYLGFFSPFTSPNDTSLNDTSPGDTRHSNGRKINWIWVLLATIWGIYTIRSSMKPNYIEVPDVKTLNRDVARVKLMDAGFESSHIKDEEPYADLYVISQSIPEGETVKKGKTIVLTYATMEEINNFQNKDSSVLFLRVDDFEFFEDGFYYREPFGEIYKIVEFQRGISGHFSFSEQLINAKVEDWTLDGQVYSEGEEEIETTFFFNEEGLFAIELPEHLQKGNYKCVLYLTNGTERYEAEFPFPPE